MWVLVPRPGGQVPRIRATEHGDRLSLFDVTLLFEVLDKVSQVSQSLVGREVLQAGSGQISAESVEKFRMEQTEARKYITQKACTGV